MPCLFVRQFAISLNAFLSMSFQCRRTTPPSLREAFLTLVIFQLLQQKFVIRTYLCALFREKIHSVYTHVGCIPSIRDREIKFVRQDQRFSSISPHGSHVLLHSSNFNVIHVYRRIIIVFDTQTDIPNSVLSLIQVPTELPRTVFPTTVGKWVSVEISFKRNRWIVNVSP